MSIFKKYASIEIKSDTFDENLCNINVIEIVEEFGKYRYEKKSKVVQKDKLEKISKEIVEILQN